MQENALELVLEREDLSVEQVKEGLAAAQNHRVYGKQVFAICAFLLQQKSENEEEYLGFMLAEYEHERASAYRYAQAGKVLLNLSTVVDRERLPRSIDQAIKLDKLSSDDQRAMWLRLISMYDQRELRADLVKAHVDDQLAKIEYSTVQEIEQSTVQKIEHVEAELVEDDEPEDEDPDFEEPEEAEEPVLAPAPPARRASHFPNFPPLGCERENRLKLLALGANLVRRVETEQGSIIYQWQESERSEGGWQQVHAGNVRQIDAHWDRLMQSATALNA